MTRLLLSVAFALCFAFSPFSAAAEEQPPTDLIPVFFFLHHEEEEPLGIVALAPVAEDEEETTWAWAYAPINTDNGQIGDFTFNIPAGATINGIEVLAEMNESVSSGNIPTLFSLSWNNGSSFTSTKTATVDGTTDANYTLGNSTDTWGRTWTDTELNNTNFRLKIDKSATSDTLNVDYVRVKVWYTTTGTASTTKQYIHTDHLGGTNVVTGAGGDAVVQVLDYYPYGTKRISSGTDTSQREFIGEMFDESSQLLSRKISQLRLRHWKTVQ